MRSRLRALAVVAVLIGGCSDSPRTTSTPAATATTFATRPADTVPPTGPAPTTPKTTTTLAKATFVVQPGTNQIAVLGDTAGDTLTVSRDGSEVAHGTVDQQGSLLFRNLDPGNGYTVSSSAAVSDTVAVADPASNPPADFYANQTKLPAGGFGYITTRDGTTLSANVILPGDGCAPASASSPAAPPTFDRCTPTSRPTPQIFRRASSPRYASRCSPSPTRSEPAVGCG
jgi:hypothetical protein